MSSRFSESINGRFCLKTDSQTVTFTVSLPDDNDGWPMAVRVTTFAVGATKCSSSHLTGMHDLEPYHKWREHYIASSDERSPFYGRMYSEFAYTQKVYNYYIHPQWDHFGSNTLYTKILFADYDQGFAILEFIGEWNDTLHEDMMVLKRNVLEPLMEEGIFRFIFICDNLLNYHTSDDDYYEELYHDLMDQCPSGWAVYLNTQPHVSGEMYDGCLDRYVQFGDHYNDLNWRVMKPHDLYQLSLELIASRTHRLSE